MLTRLNLHTVGGIKKLTLDAPRLQNVKLVHSSLQLELVHDESVESLFIDILERIDRNDRSRVGSGPGKEIEKSEVPLQR